MQDDYYSGQQVIESYHRTDGLFQAAEQYVWSPRYIDAPILRDSCDANGDVITADRIVYMTDANFNVTGILRYNAGGQKWDVVERYTYTPYGEVTYRDGNYGAYAMQESAYANTVLYTGRTLDTATDLYYYRARFYDAAMERFVNRDPIRYTGGINLYEYVGDDPINKSDPLGLCDVKLRCGPPGKVTGKLGLVHCGVIAPNGVEYGIGGGDSKSGSSGTATPYPADPNKKPTPKASNQTDYEVSCPNKSCADTQAAIQNYHDTVVPPPYNALGPNSNTYAHAMLTAIGCEVKKYKPKPYIPCTTAGPFLTRPIQAPPTKTPDGAIGW